MEQCLNNRFHPCLSVVVQSELFILVAAPLLRVHPSFLLAWLRLLQFGH